MPESTAPAGVLLEYTSAAFAHTAYLLTREWSPPAGGFDYGSYPRWDDDTAVDADDMILDLVNVIKAVYATTTTFNRYTIFTQSSPSADPVPRISKSIAVAGTDSSGSWELAVQATMNFRTEGFKVAKLVFLDLPSHDTFAKSVTVDPAGVYDEIISEYTSQANAWSGRDNTRPNTFISLTWTLNEKLRRAARLA